MFQDIVVVVVVVAAAGAATTTPDDDDDDVYCVVCGDAVEQVEEKKSGSKDTFCSINKYR